MSFPKAMNDGLRIFATDQLDMSADEAEGFARRCHEVDSFNQQYDLSAQRMSGGQYPIPSLKDRLEQAMATVAGEVRRKQQHDLARGQSSRSTLGMPVGTPGAQRLPASGVKVVNRGEGGGSAPSVPSSGAMASYYSPQSAGVTALPPQSTARYVQPNSADIAPLPPNPTPPGAPESSPQDNASGQGLNPYAGRVMATDGRMLDAAEMNDAELEAAEQMHLGLGNGREVVALQWERARRANNTQAGPQGYA
jgi:hypothetical protein